MLGTTKDTTTETSWFMLDVQLMQARQKVEHDKTYIHAVENPYNPLQEAIKDKRNCQERPGRLSLSLMKTA